MKKEIEVWVYDNDLEKAQANKAKGAYFTLTYPDDSSFKKATLVIEMPEKKIEITESELRDCFDTFQRLEEDHDRRLVYSFYEYSRRKLFGDN